MGMVPEAVVAMLACARIGAPHSVVFGGFSADALRDRINDCGAKVLLTQDGAWRRGNVVPAEGDGRRRARADADDRERGRPPSRRRRARAGRDEGRARRLVGRSRRRGHRPREALARAKTPDAFDAEHPLFILYTSGSTGKPKGVLHTTAGYLAGVHVTAKYVFDLRDDDVYWCTADVGWVTGHSYIVYGPLSCGATCLMYEGAPNFPDWGRFWSIIERHGVTILYTAPTAIRAFIRAGDEWPNKSRPLELCACSAAWASPSTPRRGSGTTASSAASAAPSSTRGGRPRPGRIMLTTLPGAVVREAGEHRACRSSASTSRS